MGSGANRDLAGRIWKLADLFFSSPVHPRKLLSVIALDHLELIGMRAKRLLHANHLALDAFLDGRSDLDVFRSKWGTVIFPKLSETFVVDGGTTILMSLTSDFRHESTARFGSGFVPGV